MTGRAERSAGQAAELRRLRGTTPLDLFSAFSVALVFGTAGSSEKTQLQYIAGLSPGP